MMSGVKLIPSLLVVLLLSLTAMAQTRPAPEIIQDEAIRLSTDLVVLDVQVLKKDRRDRQRAEAGRF